MNLSREEQEELRDRLNMILGYGITEKVYPTDQKGVYRIGKNAIAYDRNDAEYRGEWE